MLRVKMHCCEYLVILSNDTYWSCYPNCLSEFKAMIYSLRKLQWNEYQTFTWRILKGNRERKTSSKETDSLQISVKYLPRTLPRQDWPLKKNWNSQAIIRIDPKWRKKYLNWKRKRLKKDKFTNNLLFCR